MKSLFNKQLDWDNLLLVFLLSIEKQAERAFLWVPVAMATGVGFYFSLSFEPQGNESLYLFFVFTVLFLVARYVTSSIWLKAQSHLYFLSAFVALGFMIAQWHTEKTAAPVLEKEIGPLYIEGEIIDVDRQEKGIRYVLTDLFFETEEEIKIPKKVRILVRNNTAEPNVGDRIRLKGIIRPPPQPSYPGGYDFSRHAYFEQIGAVGFAFYTPEIINPASNTYFLEGLRQYIDRTVRSYIDKDPAVASVTITFMNGEKKAIPIDTLQAIRDSGLAHLLAISGLHVGMVAGILFFFIRGFLAFFPYCALHWPLKKISAFFALCGAIAFMLLVGASVPTQRAVIMTGFVLVAVMLDRTAISLRLVALAAIFVLVTSPESLMGLSFQLSFSAVVGLVVGYQWLSPYLKKLYRRQGMINKSITFLTGSMLASLITTITTAPYLMYGFNHLALYSILSNALALPIMTVLVMPFILLSYLLLALDIFPFTLFIASTGVSWMIDVAHWVAGMKGAVVFMPEWPVSAVIIMSFGAMLLILWIGSLGKALGGFLILIGLVLSFYGVRPDVLITPDTKLIAVMGKEGDYYFSQNRSNRFTRESWMQMNAQQESFVWPETRGAVSDGWLTCDEGACLYKKEGVSISFIRQHRAMVEDCQKTDYLVTRDWFVPYQYGCQKNQIIARKFLEREGGVALYWQSHNTKDPIRIETVNQRRGQRPWVK